MAEDATTPEVQQDEVQDQPKAEGGENAAAQKPVKSKPVKSKDEQEFERLVAKQKSDGYTHVEAKKVRGLAEKLGKRVPKWAQEKGKSSETKRATPATDPDSRLAHKANALAFQGKCDKDGVFDLESATVKFGARVTTVQIVAMREALKGKNIIKELGNVKLSDLKAYAAGSKRLVELSDETRAALKDLNKTFPPKMKMWARKDAVIAYILHTEERTKSNGKAKTQAPEKVAA
jgi:hypothetical protein